jgi:organic hydroperoxide reductase OsmC/OhrA
MSRLRRRTYGLTSYLHCDTFATVAALRWQEITVHPFPHVYSVAADAQSTGNVTLTAARVAAISSAPPAEFDGPGDLWSPEGLLCAAVADCFVLTFRAIARASKFEWTTLRCRVDGVLERADGVTKFTRFTTHATLTVPTGAEADKARLLMDKAEHGCLVSNSLTAARELVAEVITAA